MDDACCTCATLLSTIIPPYDEKSEKPKALDRRLECCGRVICSNCLVVHMHLIWLTWNYIDAIIMLITIQFNPRFKTYCPFCQLSTIPSPLPQGLRDPPTYTPPSSSKPCPPSNEPPPYSDDLPTYSSLTTSPTRPPEKSSPPAEDVLHFLDHEQDSLTSLSLRYGLPITVLRRANTLTSDHLLLARRTIIIPGEYYKGGISLSPRPIEGEDQERRKATVRRWQVACKVSE
jgi:LysM repeat protein